VNAEIEANFDAFASSWKSELQTTITALDVHRVDFLDSYRRIVSMNAWKTSVLETRISEGSLEFFAEALNDVLNSHVCARHGAWRSALMSLRSSIENTCYSLYYMDHPVELELWYKGEHRPAFSEIHTYLEKHPEIKVLGNSPITGLALIKTEYSTLSRAVHASSKGFRMSPNAREVVLWNADAASLGRWISRERSTLCGLNLLLTAIFRRFLQGAQQIGMRQSLSLVIPKSFHLRIKSELKVTVRIV
jgi:hypothetical protein